VKENIALQKKFACFARLVEYEIKFVCKVQNANMDVCGIWNCKWNISNGIPFCSVYVLC
jgi:hypothetical protein